MGLLGSLSKHSITSLPSPHLKWSNSLVLVPWTVMGQPLKFRTRNHSCHTADLLCHSCSCFYSSRHSWTRPQASCFTGKEQAIFYRTGEHVTKVVRMSSRRGVSSTYKGMVGPMEVHKVHKRVRCGMRVSDRAVMTTKNNNTVIRNVAMLFLYCSFSGFSYELVKKAENVWSLTTRRRISCPTPLVLFANIFTTINYKFHENPNYNNHINWHQNVSFYSITQLGVFLLSPSPLGGMLL